MYAESSTFLPHLTVHGDSNLLTSSTKAVPIIFVYFLVLSSESCPMILAIVTIFSPFFSSFVAKMCNFTCRAEVHEK
jgi:hypothetical protein